MVDIGEPQAPNGTSKCHTLFAWLAGFVKVELRSAKRFQWTINFQLSLLFDVVWVSRARLHFHCRLLRDLNENFPRKGLFCGLGLFGQFKIRVLCKLECIVKDSYLSFYVVCFPLHKLYAMIIEKYTNIPVKQRIPHIFRSSAYFIIPFAIKPREAHLCLNKSNLSCETKLESAAK